MDPRAQIPPVRHIYAINVPSALPTPPDGYRLTRAATLLDDHFADAFYGLDHLRRAVDFWVEDGYRRRGLYALAVYDHPVLDLAEVYSEWQPDSASWSPWRTGLADTSPAAPTAAENEAHAADLEQDRPTWTFDEIIRREG